MKWKGEFIRVQRREGDKDTPAMVQRLWFSSFFGDYSDHICSWRCPISEGEEPALLWWRPTWGQSACKLEHRWFALAGAFRYCNAALTWSRARRPCRKHSQPRGKQNIWAAICFSYLALTFQSDPLFQFPWNGNKFEFRAFLCSYLYFTGMWAFWQGTREL